MVESESGGVHRGEGGDERRERGGEGRDEGWGEAGVEMGRREEGRHIDTCEYMSVHLCVRAYMYAQTGKY